MTDLVKNYIAVNTICSIALLILAYVSWNNALLCSKMKKQFSIGALIAMTAIVAEIGSVIFENIGFMNRVPVLIANLIGFSLSPVVAIALSEAFSAEKGKIKSLLTIPVWINMVLVISSPWTGLIFKVDSDISYSRGPMFGVYMCAYLCSYTILLMASVKCMKYYQCHTKSTFIMLSIFTILGTTVQLILPHVHISWLCITLSMILFYAYFCTLTQSQDNLTGLLNRNVYDQHTNSMYHRLSGIVIVFDLDNFKRINDIYGHQWGDSCLQMIGKMIKDCFYKIGLCYRIGGDEFCVICKTTDEKKVKDAIKLFHRKMDQARITQDLQGKLPMVSTGDSIFYGSAMEYATALKKADEQMYDLKNNRKING